MHMGPKIIRTTEDTIFDEVYFDMRLQYDALGEIHRRKLLICSKDGFDWFLEILGASSTLATANLSAEPQNLKPLYPLESGYFDLRFSGLITVDLLVEGVTTDLLVEGATPYTDALKNMKALADLMITDVRDTISKVEVKLARAKELLD
jgi:hypothetical protein